MKKIFLALVLFGTLTASIAQDKKSQKRDIGPFNELNAGKGINVTLIEGDKEQLVVEIINADLSDVITELKGRTLEIKLKTKIYKDVAVQVFATYKSIKAIKTGTGAFVDSESVIHAENLDLRAGSGSTIILDIDTKSVSSSLSSSKIELVGKTDFQDVKTNTGGKYIANNLTSKQTFVRAATGGSAWVSATEKLEAKTSTGGRVTYTGEPEKLIINGNVEKEE